MFADLGNFTYTFQVSNYTYNHHHYSVGVDSYETDAGLKDFWTMTSKSRDDVNTGKYFAASIESKKYPIFGTQFHPEKPSELWVDGYAINHEWESIQLNDYFAKFFVEMARANKNTFGSFADTQKWEISNYDVVQTSSMADIYVFK